MAKETETAYGNPDSAGRSTQWHMALPPAIKLELADYKQALEYHTEYLLNTKALQIDLLIIKKNGDIHIENEIGAIFKKHNIIEYKSPYDSMGLNEYFKAHAYAELYKIGNDSKNAAPEDITITMIRDKKPVKLLKWFRQHECGINEEYRGIYYITRAGFFKTQIIVSGELDGENHIWLKALTDSMDKIQAKHLISKAEELLEKSETEYAESVLQIAMKANREIFEKIKREDKIMYSALVELMKPEIDAAVDAAVGEAVGAAVDETTAKNTVIAIENAIKKLRMSEEEACSFMDTTIEQYRGYKKRINKA